MSNDGETSNNAEAAKLAKSEKKWPGYYRCDDLYPPLCDGEGGLTVARGSVETLPGMHVSYWRYTPRTLVEKTKFPIVVLNGGPGLPHNFATPSRSLACDGREVVLYDQAGTGDSQIDRGGINDANKTVEEMYPELFAIDYCAETELPALLRELGWKNYHIVAESWGTQIAFQFAVGGGNGEKSREGLRSLIMNAPIADNHKFIEYQWGPDGSLSTLPTYVQERLKHFNRTRDFDSEEFAALEKVVSSNFNARLGLLVDCWLDTVAAGTSTLNLDRMMGRTDVFYPGDRSTIRGWTVLPRLRELRDVVPVQLNRGKYDMVRPPLVADTAERLGGSMVECHPFATAAHAILLDEPRQVYPAIADFLIRVEDTATPFRARRGTCPGANLGGGTGNTAAGNTAAAGLTTTPPPSDSGTHFLLAGAVFFLGSIGCAFKLGMPFGARQRGKAHGYKHVGEAHKCDTS